MQKELATLSKKLAKAFNTNSLIAPLPSKFCKNTKNAKSNITNVKKNT